VILTKYIYIGQSRALNNNESKFIKHIKGPRQCHSHCHGQKKTESEAQTMQMASSEPVPLCYDFNPSHALFLWTKLWTLSYRNNDLLIISLDLILIISYLTDAIHFRCCTSYAHSMFYLWLTHICLAAYTAGTRWCLPGRNLFLDMFCNHQTVFLMETWKIYPTL